MGRERVGSSTTKSLIVKTNTQYFQTKNSYAANSNDPAK